MYKELRDMSLIVEIEKLVKNTDKVDEEMSVYSALIKQRILNLSGNN
ncbi:MAG: hypothetical protein LUB59_05690 [Candidatus Gastranaerophilales bacterium]|nr:hypothetical protein [Candidatus Gastranaerophilales bacterium]